MQLISNGRIYFIHSDRMYNPLLHHPWSESSLSKDDANPVENKHEDAADAEEKEMVTRSSRVVKSTLYSEFEYYFHVVPEAPQDHLLAILASLRRSRDHLLAPPTSAWSSSTYSYFASCG